MSKSGLFAHFKSKEALQVQILEYEAQRFIDRVVRKALKAPRGEERVRALFEGWLQWIEVEHADTGCLMIAAAAELDDRDGPARQQLVDHQSDLFELFANVVRTAMGHGAFRADLDPEQFAREVQGIILAYQHASRLLGDPLAGKRARTAFERLVADARSS